MVFLSLCLCFCFTAPIYAFAEEALNADELGKMLAEEATYINKTLDGDVETVFISFDIEAGDFSNLMKLDVLKAFTKYAFEKQKDFASEEAKLLSKTQIAGEAFLHMLGYRLTKAFGGDSGPFATYYNQFKVVEINIDEARISPAFINFIGMILAP